MGEEREVRECVCVWGSVDVLTWVVVDMRRNKKKANETKQRNVRQRQLETPPWRRGAERGGRGAPRAERRAEEQSSMGNRGAPRGELIFCCACALAYSAE